MGTSVGAPFGRLGGYLAALVGAGGLLYAFLFGLIVRGTSLNVQRAWFVLAVLGGLAATGVFVALYDRLRVVDQPLALWAMLLGVAAALGQMLNASVGLSYIASLSAPPYEATPDPVGFLRFGLNGVALLLFGLLLLRAGSATRMLAYLALSGGLVLVVTYLGRLCGFVTPATRVTLIPPFLYGIAIHPLFYIGVARYFLQSRSPATA